MDLELTLAQNYLPVTDEAEVTFLLRLVPTVNQAADYPLDIRFVLDRSGSMSEQAAGGLSKIEALKESVKQSLEMLRQGKDYLCIIVYDDNMQVLVDRGVVRDINALKALVDRVMTGGSTHLSSPLRHALEAGSQKDGSQKDVLSKVIVFTDGMINHPSETSEERNCFDLARQARKMGIPLSVFGTGIDYNERFLKQMAELAGLGSYYEHVSQVGMVRLRLEDDFENLQSIQDRDVRVKIAVGNNVSILEATKYVPQQAILSTDGKTAEDKFQGLDARGQSYLVRSKVLCKKTLGSLMVGTVTVEWKSVGGLVTKSLPIEVNFTDDENLISPVNKTVLNTVLNTEAVKATLAGQYRRAATLFTKAGNQPMVEELKTLSGKDEEAERAVRTVTVTDAHKGTIVKKNNASPRRKK